MLSKALGEDGKRKLANAQRLKQQVDKAWGENGSSQKALEDLLAFVDGVDDS